MSDGMSEYWKAKRQSNNVKEIKKSKSSSDLDVKVNLERTEKDRITVKITLFKDGEAIASDQDSIEI